MSKLGMTTKDVHSAMTMAAKAALVLPDGELATTLWRANKGHDLWLLRAIHEICQWQDARTRQQIIDDIKAGSELITNLE